MSIIIIIIIVVVVVVLRYYNTIIYKITVINQMKYEMDLQLIFEINLKSSHNNNNNK
jgi:hypothetical protein